MVVDELGTISKFKVLPIELIHEFESLLVTIHNMASRWAVTPNTAIDSSSSTSVSSYVDYSKLDFARGVLAGLRSAYGDAPLVTPDVLLRDTRRMKKSLVTLAQLGGWGCREAVSLRGELWERFKVLEASLMLLT